MRATTPSLLAFVLASGLSAQALPQQPLAQLPYTPSLNTKFMDTSVQACDNFYKYACGNWIKQNPIPDDQSSWDVYRKLGSENQLYLWGLLLEAAKTEKPRSANMQKIGDMFSSCMDESAAEKLGATPLQASLARINALRGLAQLPALLAVEHSNGSGMLLSFGAQQDFADSNSVIAGLGAGGLGLPDRDYYTKTDAKSVELRAKYLAHVERMLGLLGEDPLVAKAGAAAVLRIETELAKASLTRVERRDPHKLDHKMTVAELTAIAPFFDWKAYFTAMGTPEGVKLNVTEPEFIKEMAHELHETPLVELKAYLRWHLVRAKSASLSKAFVDANFDFYSKTLRGTATQQPRWKRCVQTVDRTMGEALGQIFVEKTFTKDTLARTKAMTSGIEAAMKAEIESLPWMSAETKARALEKLKAVVNKVGYPEKWRDYSSLEIRPGDYFGNLQRAAAFERRRDMSQIGKPVDRTEWGMSPPTVNAYYSAQMNDINFPAGVLQPPLFDPKMDDAPNYGNTGATIGHELTHGFDDQGRQFDAKGNLQDWWTKADAAEFQKRADCIVEQYSSYTVVDDIRINGKLTLGEDAADLGGQLLAFIAWKAATKQLTLKPVDGLNPDQRFFVGMAQWACGSERPESLRVHAATDPHSPGEYRINGVVSNMPQFQQAFGCKVGQPMVREKACKIW